MAVVAAPPTVVPRAERRGTGLLLAGWILGLIGFLISLGVLAWAFLMLAAMAVPVGELFIALGAIAWVALLGPVLGLIGTILTYMAWSKAKEGEDPGALGIVGGVLLLIGMPGFIGLVGGILAIIGGVQAKG